MNSQLLGSLELYIFGTSTHARPGLWLVLNVDATRLQRAAIIELYLNYKINVDVCVCKYIGLTTTEYPEYPHSFLPVLQVYPSFHHLSTPSIMMNIGITGYYTTDSDTERFDIPAGTGVYDICQRVHMELGKVPAESIVVPAESIVVASGEISLILNIE